MNLTIYFRKDVWDKLKDEQERSALVNRLLAEHYRLGGNEYPKVQTKITATGLQGKVVQADVDTDRDQFVPVGKFVPRAPDPEEGYPCCSKARPCKHWQWSSEKSAYVNTLTGKTREPDL